MKANLTPRVKGYIKGSLASLLVGLIFINLGRNGNYSMGFLGMAMAMAGAGVLLSVLTFLLVAKIVKDKTASVAITIFIIFIVTSVISSWLRGWR